MWRRANDPSTHAGGGAIFIVASATDPDGGHHSIISRCFNGASFLFASTTDPAAAPTLPSALTTATPTLRLREVAPIHIYCPSSLWDWFVCNPGRMSCCTHWLLYADRVQALAVS
ncbi:hypothetical protein BDA96_02G064600 [Sorghum bicolor]|uniref:Uncharacterized protein n=1 Tax=Sorghum bicolor TaxID=4558 RepID=A0A921RKP1_SORBI|nr:hypothetical protein BDA96_02G064600 [Sorghum bicolor]